MALPLNFFLIPSLEKSYVLFPTVENAIITCLAAASLHCIQGNLDSFFGGELSAFSHIQSLHFMPLKDCWTAILAYMSSIAMTV